MQKLGIPVNLGHEISAASPLIVRGFRIRSAHKIDFFYLLPASLMLLGLVLSMQWHVAWIPAVLLAFVWLRWCGSVRRSGVSA